MRHFRHPNSPTASPGAKLCADARQVVANPEQHAHRPLLRRLAWMTLTIECGNMVDQRRLAEMSVEVGNRMINGLATKFDRLEQMLNSLGLLDKVSQHGATINEVIKTGSWFGTPKDMAARRRG
jgi:hypothetical protein